MQRCYIIYTIYYIIDWWLCKLLQSKVKEFGRWEFKTKDQGVDLTGFLITVSQDSKEICWYCELTNNTTITLLGFKVLGSNKLYSMARYLTRESGLMDSFILHPIR